ncbi:MAG: hypothetical protein LBC87_04025 [Fibromonadaceae bacterium]|jgi:hypothetical protein|nr:hypothetical protein [Fibromonadaceae bacterium]
MEIFLVILSVVEFYIIVDILFRARRNAYRVLRREMNELNGYEMKILCDYIEMSLNKMLLEQTAVVRGLEYDGFLIKIMENKSGDSALYKINSEAKKILQKQELARLAELAARNGGG